jgi:pimeloyl-ACP methyl ester carboxylesterase
MPTQLVNGARLFYETYGKDQPGRAPLLLIHGAPHTGAYDWAEMAPRLASAPGGGYRQSVIVPDCRGHGQSDNPNLTYSFSELAADMAGLLRALGYPKAHVVGHSNGGNVALLMLMEQPDVVQSCVLQAANGYVSQDFVEREPRAFDPERVEREVPAWRDELIALHGATNGAGYWRDLLRLTVQALISGPNYTPEELGRVRKPVLVIQGAEDTVNNVGHHAEYLAEHIPGAQLWLPAGVGHSPHKERPDEWLERYLAFIEPAEKAS